MISCMSLIDIIFSKIPAFGFSHFQKTALRVSRHSENTYCTRAVNTDCHLWEIQISRFFPTPLLGLFTIAYYL